MADVLEAGDAVSEFAMPSVAGKEIRLSDKVGVPVVLLFTGNDAAAAHEVCASLAAAYEDLAGFGAYALGIQMPGAPKAAANGHALPFEMLRDPNGSVTRNYGAAAKWRAALIRPDGRLAGYYDADPATLGQRIVADVTAFMTLESPRKILQQAPVLLIPDVLPPDYCLELIDVWKTQGNADSGFMVEQDGKTVGIYDYNHKIRRDHFVQNGTPLYVKLRDYIARRIVGQIKKAFNFDCTRLEQIKIACYDASRGGYFRPHRDNTTGGTAHRQFAVSLLLNDEYEGGYLRFPEFGPHLYRPPAGGAVVFGCSLLHEVTDITAGQRYIVLTFLYGEREWKMREDFARKQAAMAKTG